MKLNFNQKRKLKRTLQEVKKFLLEPYYIFADIIKGIKSKAIKRPRAIYNSLIIPDSCFISKSNSRGLIIRK